VKKNVDITQTKSMIKECIDRLGFEGLRTWAVGGGKPKSCHRNPWRLVG